MACKQYNINQLTGGFSFRNLSWGAYIKSMDDSIHVKYGKMEYATIFQCSKVLNGN